MMNEVIIMATFLVLGLPTLLGASFLVVFYIALSRDSARKRHSSHPPYEVFVAFKLDQPEHPDQPDQRPGAATAAPQDRGVSTATRNTAGSTVNRMRARRVHAA
jgi:hypothetical protein